MMVPSAVLLEVKVALTRARPSLGVIQFKGAERSTGCLHAGVAQAQVV